MSNNESKIIQRVGLFFTLGACILGIVPMEKQASLWGIPLWWKETRTFFPGLNHSIFALVLLLPLYIRQLLKFEKWNLETTASFLINLLLFGVWMNILLGAQWKEGLVTYALIAVISLTWLGVSSIAGWVWLALLALVAWNILEASDFMQWRGFLFLAFSFLGVAMQTKLTPRNFVSEIITTYQPQRVINSAKESLEATGNTLRTNNNKKPRLRSLTELHRKKQELEE